MAEELLTFPLRQGDNTVWHVYVEATPGDDWERIGRIEATGPFVASLWADQRMFFRHQNYGEDLLRVPLRDRSDWVHFIENEFWLFTPVDPLPEDRDDASDVV